MSIRNVIRLKKYKAFSVNSFFVLSIVLLIISFILFLSRSVYIGEIANIIRGDGFTIILFALSLLGLLVTIFGTYIAYITYINPMIRFKSFLSLKKNWERCKLGNELIEIYRYKKYPSFQIKINYERNEQFYEKWIPEFPDKRVTKYDVSLEVNGLALDIIRFISLDGGRYLIPLPEKKYENEKITYYYNQKMIKLSYIISYYYNNEGDILNFVKIYNLPIKISNNYD